MDGGRAYRDYTSQLLPPRSFFYCFLFSFCFALASIHSHLLLARDCVSPFVLARLDFTHEWLKLYTFRILSTLCSSCLCYAILLLLLF